MDRLAVTQPTVASPVQRSDEAAQAMREAVAKASEGARVQSQGTRRWVLASSTGLSRAERDRRAARQRAYEMERRMDVAHRFGGAPKQLTAQQLGGISCTVTLADGTTRLLNGVQELNEWARQQLGEGPEFPIKIQYGPPGES